MSITCASPIEIDEIVVVDQIVPRDVFEAVTISRVKLADIDASQMGEPEYIEVRALIYI